MRLRGPVFEPIWMCNERGIEAGLSGDLQRLGMAVVNGVRRHVANA